MTNIKSIIAIIVTATFLFSCKKTDHHDEPAPESISFTISSPAPMQEYEYGDTVFIKSLISSPSELHGYEVHLTRLADSIEVYSNDQHSHSTTIEINEYWINNNKIHSDMELEIIAEIDHDGNTINKKVKFHCHPM